MEPILPDPNTNTDVPVGSLNEAGMSSNPEKDRSTSVEQPKEVVGSTTTSVNPAISQDDTATDQQGVSSSAMPATAALSSDDDLIAEDTDVIEKEWVQKAKKIVQTTKDDPHAQEQEVSKLQAEYLKKRYGKDLRVSE